MTTSRTRPSSSFASLRWGELASLRRKNIDLGAGIDRIERSLTELAGGGYYFRAAQVMRAGLR